MDKRIAMHMVRLALGLAIGWVTSGAAVADTGVTPEPRPKVVEHVAVPPPSPSEDPLAKRVSELYGQSHEIRTAAVAHHAKEHTEIEGFAAGVAERKEALGVALSMPHAAPGRAEQIDSVYAQLSRDVVRARAARSAAVERRIAAEETHETARLEAAGGSPALGEAQQSLLDAHILRTERASEHVWRWSDALEEARTVWRQARPGVSPRMEALDDTILLREVVVEMQDLPTEICLAMESMASSLGTGGGGLDRVQALGGVLVDLLKLIALLVLVLLIHRHIGGWFGIVLRAVDNRSSTQGSAWQASRRFPRWMVGGDLSALEAPGSVWLRAAVELMGGALFSIGLAGISAPLAWIAQVFAARGAVRWLTACVDLVFITPQDTRPALRVTAPRVRDGLRQTIWAFSVLFAVEYVLVRLSIDVLNADRLADSVEALAIAIVWLLTIVVLHRWGPAIRDRIREGGAEGSLAGWIVAENRLGLLSAIAGGSLLTIRWVLVLGEQIIEGRAGLSWLAAAIARRHLRDDTQDARAPADPALLAAIEANALDHVNVDAHVAPIISAFEAWNSGGRQGMVVISADRGMGRSVVLARTEERLRPTLPVVRLSLPERITDSAAALKWLAEGAGVADSGEPESLARALVGRERTVFIIQDLHHLYLRSVGGYDALRVVLEAMQACSTRHFWICGIHGPAWTFLNGVAAAAPLAVFRTRIAIQPMEPRQIASWLEARTLAAGIQPRFDALMQRPARGPDGIRLLERATVAYWRVVTDAAQGNPRVALDLWLKSLRASEPGTLEVGMFSMPDPEDIEDLSDDDLFTLTGIVLHDEIRIESLAEALNLPVNRVRAKCRQLEDRGIVTPGTVVRVRASWLPAVERILRRRNFLHRR